MVTKRRLLLLSCTKRKRPRLDALSALERYDGPTFRVLRHFISEQPEQAEHLDVYVLSALHGLIHASQPILPYDEIMTEQRAFDLRESVLSTFANIVGTDYIEACIAMSRKYSVALQGWSMLTPSETLRTVLSGGHGLMLARLKLWLWGTLPERAEKTDDSARERGIAYLHGIKLQMTPEHVFDLAQLALNEDRARAGRFREWYVTIGDERVAPKWLVSKLTGLPVGTFTSGEARRVLKHLGIVSNRVECK